MLHITGSTRTLKAELRVAHNIISNILDALHSSRVDTKNLTATVVGPFVVNMPEFKVLAKDAEDAKQLLRKVCTGEVSAGEAYASFHNALQEIRIISQALDSIPNL